MAGRAKSVSPSPKRVHFCRSVVFIYTGRHDKRGPVRPAIYRSASFTRWCEKKARNTALRLALEMGYSGEEGVCRGDKKIVVAVSASQDKDRRGRRWILDSGAGRHFIAVASARGLKRVAIDAVRLMTANGVISSKQAVQVKIVGGLTADALVLPDSPNLLSLGRLCMLLGYSFVWRCGKTPILIGRDGQVFRCNVENFVPFVDAEQPEVDRPKWLNTLVAAVVGDGAVPAVPAEGVGVSTVVH